MARVVNFINHGREVVLLRRESFPVAFLPSMTVKIMTAVNTGRRTMPGEGHGGDFEIKERVALCRSLSANCFPQRVAKIALEGSKFLPFVFIPRATFSSHRSSVDLIARVALVANIRVEIIYYLSSYKINSIKKMIVRKYAILLSRLTPNSSRSRSNEQLNKQINKPARVVPHTPHPRGGHP